MMLGTEQLPHWKWLGLAKDPDTMTSFERDEAQIFLLNAWLAKHAMKRTLLAEAEAMREKTRIARKRRRYMTTTRSLMIIAMLLLSRVASAQTTPPSLPLSEDVLVLPATGDPLTIASIGLRNTLVGQTSPNCNQVALPACPLPCVNPSIVEIDDPFNLGKFCRLAIPVGLPVGSGYRIVAEAFVPSCTVNGIVISPCGSGRSAVGVPPFDIASIPGRPAVPTNVGVKR